MKIPLVSVVMPVYNSQASVSQAIQSILDQTFGDFELIIIDDGSNDGTEHIVDHFARTDPRVRAIHQENVGVTDSLNKGCLLARGKYIARMDGDDISLRQRFAKQVAYLEAHPHIGILGTSLELIDEKGEYIGVTITLPSSPHLVRWFLPLEIPLVHPAVMMRRDLVMSLGLYSNKAIHAEDYDLWVRASYKTSIANLPEALVEHRRSSSSVSKRFRSLQQESVVQVMKRSIDELLCSSTPLPTIRGLREMLTDPPLRDLHIIKDAASTIEKLHLAYLQNNQLSASERTEVAKDAARRLVILAGFAYALTPLMFMRLLLRASRLDPELLSKKSMLKGFDFLRHRLNAPSAVNG